MLVHFSGGPLNDETKSLTEETQAKLIVCVIIAGKPVTIGTYLRTKPNLFEWQPAFLDAKPSPS